MVPGLVCMSTMFESVLCAGAVSDAGDKGAGVKSCLRAVEGLEVVRIGVLPKTTERIFSIVYAGALNWFFETGMNSHVTDLRVCPQ